MAESSSEQETMQEPVQSGNQHNARSTGIMNRKTSVDDFFRNCNQYNAVSWKLDYSAREKACNAETYCHFVGQTLLGECKFGFRKENDRQEDDQYETLAKSGSYDSLFEYNDAEDSFALHYQRTLKALKEDEGAQKLLRTAAGEAIAERAAEGLAAGRAAAAAAARSALEQALTRSPALTARVAHALGSLLREKGISTPIVWEICNLISTEYVSENSARLLANTVVWLLQEYKPTKDQGAELGAHLAGLDETAAAAAALLAWALAGPEEDKGEPTAAATARSALSQASAEAIPSLKEVTELSLKSIVSAYLTDAHSKEAAKDVTLAYLEKLVNIEEAREDKKGGGKTEAA